MRLYYCIVCGSVYAFNLFDIEKRDLEKVGEKPCAVCKAGGGSLLPLKIWDRERAS